MKKTPLFTLRSLFFVILTSYKVQTPYYFFDFWRILTRERLPFFLVSGFIHIQNIVTVHGQKWRNYKKTPLITSHSLFFVIFMSYKVQTPHYFFDFWRFLARERLQNILLGQQVLQCPMGLSQGRTGFLEHLGQLAPGNRQM